MTRRLAASAVALAALSFLPVRTPAQDAPRQPGAVYDADKKGETPAPAPKRDLSGVWEPAAGPRWDPLESTCRHASLSIL